MSEIAKESSKLSNRFRTFGRMGLGIWLVVTVFTLALWIGGVMELLPPHLRYRADSALITMILCLWALSSPRPNSFLRDAILGGAVLLSLLTFVKSHILDLVPTGAWNTSPVIAVGGVLTALGLLVGSRRGEAGLRLGQWLLFAASYLGLSALLGHLWGTSALQALPLFDDPSLPSAVGLFAVPVLMNFLNPEAGIMPLFSSDGSGSRTLRRALPSAVGLYALTAILISVGLHVGWYDANFALDLMFLQSLTIFGYVIFSMARRANASHRELNQTLERLRHAEALYQDLYDNAPDMMVSVDSATATIRSMNRTALEKLGYRSEEVLGQPIMQIYTEESQAIARKLMSEFRVSGAIRDQELTIKTKSGRLIDVSLNSSAVRDASGKVMYSRSVWRDITDAKKSRDLVILEKSRLETARLRANFIASMSHEIRTPLNGVVGLSDMLMLTELSEKQRDFAESIQASAQTLLDLVNDILDFSKVESGNVQLNLEEFSFADMVADLRKQFQWRAEQKGLRFTVLTQNVQGLAVTGDRFRIQQILTNLLSNAIKFTDEGGIEIEVRMQEPVDGRARVHLSVSDTGVGMSGRDLQMLFQPFVQTAAGVAKRQGGTGLGLSISQSLAKLMDAEIKVVSRLGKGSIFSLDLDLVARPQEIVRPVSERTSFPGTDRPPRILVAEDVETNQKVVRLMLTHLGCRVECVPDGVAAIAAAQIGNFDLIFMDCQMPRLDGIEATKMIRAGAGSFRDIPIVAMTANATVEDRRACLDAGMNGFMAKPVSLAALRQELARHQFGASPAEARPLANDDQLLEELWQLGDGSPAVIEELLQVFEAQLRSRLDRVASAATQGDTAEVRRACHAIKSSAAALGGRRVAEACDASAKGFVADPDSITTMMNRIETICRAFVSDVRSWVGTKAHADGVKKT